MIFRIAVLVSLVWMNSACLQTAQFSETEEKGFNLEFELRSINHARVEERQTMADALWDTLKNAYQIPFTADSTAFFLYKGSVQSMAVHGDFNAWSTDRSISTAAVNVEGTDLWYLKMGFPNNARLDYKLVLNENQWILDPNNPNRQWSGFGPNSELAMPNWTKKEVTVEREGIAKGQVVNNTIVSRQLNYQLQFQVYLPANYELLTDLPVLYVTDGQEYSNPLLGNLITILDNLITDGTIKPIIVVFIDPRNPANLSENRRMEEYTVNEQYFRFVTSELIPFIDSNFKSATTASARAILGTSLGGLNSTYFAAVGTDFFGKFAAQSPAYWYRPEIFNMVEDIDLATTDWVITAGTYHDGLENAERMKQKLETRTASFQFTVVNEGHSWGAWSQLLDEMLIHFFGN